MKLPSPQENAVIIVFFANWVALPSSAQEIGMANNDNNLYQNPFKYGGDAVTVAVFEHQSFSQTYRSKILRKEGAMHVMTKNLDVFKYQAKRAKREGAKIVVFPDSGLYGSGLSRSVIAPYLEDIPDPRNPYENRRKLCPCEKKLKKIVTMQNTVQEKLSCMAENVGLYIAATMGDKKPCPLPKVNYTRYEYMNKTVMKEEDPVCPSEGFYYFNTAVVYDTRGCLVARYHKQNVFFESQFDTPPRPEEVWFDSPHGRFGVLMSFDLVYSQPALALIEKHKVDHVIFPIGWIDQKPMYHAISMYSAFAVGNGVNLLAANLYLPGRGFTGSGIYTPDGAESYTYDDGIESDRLLIANVPRRPRKTGKWLKPPPPKLISFSAAMRDTAEDPRFYSWLYRDHYAFLQLREMTASMQACRHGFCCFLHYNMSYYDPEEAYGFGVFSGLHTYQGRYFFQICVLTRCRILQHPETCGDGVMSANSRFNSIYIDGTYSANGHVWPVMVTNNSLGGIGLLSSTEFNFSMQPFPYLAISQPSKPIISVALIGRNYTRDSANRQLFATKETLLIATVSTILIIAT